MQNIVSHIDSIESKIKIIVDKMRKLEAECAELKEENSKLKESLELNRREREEMKDVVQGAHSSDELNAYKKKFKKELDSCMKDVESCLGMMEEVR